jgi:hypothetical protein
VAGAGNGFTVWLLRHSHRKRGATDRPDLRNTAPVLDPTNGRNRSYGNQQYTFGKRWGWREAESQAASEVVELEDDGLDVFKRETEALLFGGNSGSDWPQIATAKDALQVMKLLDEIRTVMGLRRNYSS